MPAGPAGAAGTEAGPVMDQLMGMSLDEDRSLPSSSFLLSSLELSDTQSL